jgi:predicted DNA-binding protein with PD1-like motif
MTFDATSVMRSLAAAGLALTLMLSADAQQSQAPLPPGYIRPTPVKPGMAPKMKVEETTAPAHVFQLRFATGDEILSGLQELAETHHITAAYITGLGGLSTATLGFGDPTLGFAFRKVAVDEKAELVSLVGDISLRDGKPYVHVHCVVAVKDGSTRGGHMIEAHVDPVAEITVVATAMGAG